MDAAAHAVFTFCWIIYTANTDMWCKTTTDFLFLLPNVDFTKIWDQASYVLTADGFELAITINNPAMSEFDIHIFEPLII